ncbi:MAG: hypothetical protein QM704_19640 [Anaeromyxobacteraceae bacterium]
MSRLAFLPALLVLAACGKPDVGPHTGGGGGATAATYASITTGLMVPRCATGACHGGSSPVAFPPCDANRWYAAMVDVESQQAPGVKLIAPGDPDSSYLVHKLRGTHALVGGGGARMPIADAALDDAEQAAVEAWIANGATR